MLLDIENLIHFFFGIRISAKTNQAIGSNQDILEYVDAIVEQSIVSANKHSIARIETTHCCFPEILVRNVKDIETRHFTQVVNLSSSLMNFYGRYPYDETIS